MWKNYHRVLIGFLLVFISAGCFAQIPELTARLESRDDSSLLIAFVLQNNSSSDVKVLSWNTPLEEEFNADVFRVFYKGEETSRVAYTGRLLKRGLPSAEDYVVVGAGEAVSVELDISQGYATYAAGEYIISFQAPVTFQDLDTDTSYSIKLSSASLTAQQSFELEPLPSNKEGRSVSCSASQDADIQAARNAAKTLAADADIALSTTAEAQRATAERYTTWFGAYQASRYNTVSTHFNKIRDAVENKPLQFICNSSDCRGGTFAFVYSNTPYEIYVCDGFWNAAVTGTDSRAGTIIHELSHFDVIAGTDDYQYGQSNTQQLAISDPNKAIDNADNHEYFAENTPALSMGGGSVTPPPPPASSPVLTLGVPVSGTLNAGEWAYYEVTGATSVTLYHLTQDFDLYIGNGHQPREDSYACRPYFESTASETCTISNTMEETLYIGVKAYDAAGSYALVATTQGVAGGGVTGSNEQALSLGVPVSGFVNEAEWHYYQVTGASNITLFGLSSDIDLFVSETGRPTLDDHNCASYNPGDLSEICIPLIQGTVIVGVRGYNSGNYQLVANGSSGGASTTRIQLNHTSFNLGEQFQMNMQVTGSGGFDTYAGVIFPDGSLYTFSPPLTVNPVNTIFPYHQGLQVSGEQTFTILNLALPAYLPRGTYQACSLIIPQGLSTATANWTSVDCQEFVIR